MRLAIVLLLVAACAVSLVAQDSGDPPRYAGRPLVEVLQDLNRRGLRIVFSTSLVPAALRVNAEPRGTPREILDQVLRPHGLSARSGAQGVLIVARAPTPRDDAGPARVEAPPTSDQPAPTAILSGQVRDESGEPISGAVITVTPEARGAISRTTAGVDGRFEIGGLARGRYAVICEHPGLLPAVISYMSMVVSSASCSPG